jgi:hypothetical protein
MTRETYRRFLLPPADGGDHTRSCVCKLVVCNAKSSIFQQSSEEARTVTLHAWWVDGIEVE